ncbi:MAG: calcium-binding protein [Okeania sp. SIO3I5]|uniref:calcium-binding protein n=1 Tax=Okeania sp. SIO3I5 TaxID=2607805 RepID=UPI0013B62A04|nr:calcium-binding protein [Okeania sp. SIO3I5]NEQ41495.1 calcium-binding protein [Okeania sp. SIO3I5]
MTVIPNPTPPSVDVPNPDVDDGGRTLVATPGPDRLPGTSGSDNISSLADDDFVAAGAGNDVVVLGGGDDSVTGGPGTDSLQGNRGADSIDAGTGDDSVRGGRDNDTIGGGEGSDILFGDRGDDVVDGGAGNDNVQGNIGNDALGGDAGNDTLEGGKGADTLDGGIGDDFLSGARGNDVLTGGTGADDFFFWFNANGSYGVDTLTDFNRDEGDRIVLAANFPVPEDARFNALTGTPTGSPLPADEFAVIENFNPAVDGDNPAAIIYDPANGLVYYNPTGTLGDEEQIARVTRTNPDGTLFYDADNPLQNTDFEIF